MILQYTQPFGFPKPCWFKTLYYHFHFIIHNIQIGFYLIKLQLLSATSIRKPVHLPLIFIIEPTDGTG
jgi:hypothetical protein